MRTDRIRLLFICTGNAGRSALAEVMFRRLAGDDIEVSSAGVDPWDQAHPMACRLATEQGLDLSTHRPRHVRETLDPEPEVVVTIGDRADTETPDYGAGVRRIHWDIADPADADGTPESEKVFRATMREIAARLPSLRQGILRVTRPHEIALQPAISTCCVRPKPLDPEVHLPLIAEAGFRAIELCCYVDEPADFPWEDQNEIKRLSKVAADHGVRIWSVHPPDRYNLTAVSESDRRGQVDVAKRSIDVAEQLGAAAVILHAGHRMPAELSHAERRERLDTSLCELAEYATSTAVTLCLETLFEHDHQLLNGEIIDRIKSNSASAFGLVIDTGHSALAGNLYGTAQKAGRRLRTLHLQDNFGKRDDHILPGSGRIDWKRFMADLKESGYSGPLMLEASDKDARPVREYLADCRKSAEYLMTML